MDAPGYVHCTIHARRLQVHEESCTSACGACPDLLVDTPAGSACSWLSFGALGLTGRNTSRLTCVHAPPAASLQALYPEGIPDDVNIAAKDVNGIQVRIIPLKPLHSRPPR